MPWHVGRRFASIDFETCSTADLPKIGPTKYAMDPETHVWCLAYQIEDEPIELWLRGDPVPVTLVQHIVTGGLLCAWNANFERQVWRHIMHARHGWPAVPEDAWSCTMANAMYWGLPARLEYCALALHLVEQKDEEGSKLMMRMAGPVNSRARNADPRLPPEWDSNPEHLIRLGAYCMQDVVTERAIQRRIAPLPDRERALWLLDQDMNGKGMRIDLDLVRRMEPLAAETALVLHERMTELTQGEVIKTSQRDVLLVWLNNRLPEKLPDLKKDTIVKALARMPECLERDVLECRMSGRFASPAKLRKLQDAVCKDGHLHDLLRYYGAGRTGRWSGAGGSGVQLQNLPRPTIKNVALATELIMSGCPADFLDLAFEDSGLGVVASCIRGCFIADQGNLLTCADLANIEARVLPWLAGQRDVLEVFLRGEDIYTFTAGLIGSTDRQLGKVIRLALGFGMGAPRFVATAEQWRIPLDILDAMEIVQLYRHRSPYVVQFWWDLERAMKRCIERDRLDSSNLTEREPVGWIAFQRGRSGVAMILPNGRHLLYRHARIEDGEITYDGLHQKTHKWGPIRTYGGKLAENATQAVARDVMAEAMLVLAGMGHDLRLTSHDEIIGQAHASIARQRLDEMIEVMSRDVVWAPGLPVGATGFTAERYRKG